MKTLTVLSLLCAGCIVDRTGQSATSLVAQESAQQSHRVEAAEALVKRLSTRIGELEEVISYRGEQEEIELENLEGIEMEFRRIRNQVETIQRSSTQGASQTLAFRSDADARLTEALKRLERLEQSLGLGGSSPQLPPKVPVEAKPAEAISVPNEPEKPEAPDSAKPIPEEPVEAPVEKEAVVDNDDPLVLAEQALTDGHPRVARAVLERAMREVEGAADQPELLYRYAETWFAEGLFEQAGLRYQKVVDQAKGSSWSAWAMVRQGECFQHLGNAEGARFFWEDVIRQYPDSEASKLAESLLKG
jgi:TolA-binding protein